jgi:hypothetical protein
VRGACAERRRRADAPREAVRRREPLRGLPRSADRDAAAVLHPAKVRPRGWGSTGAVCAELIEAVRPEVIVELGAFLGASALHMAAVSRNLSLSPAILCIDDFRGWPAFRERFRRDVPPPRHGDARAAAALLHGVRAGRAVRVGRVRGPHRGGRRARLPLGVGGHQPGLGRAPTRRRHVRPRLLHLRGRAPRGDALRQGQGAHHPPPRPALGALPEAARQRATATPGER